MKIQKPFRYMGSKGRFYKEIKQIFINSGKKKYIDLFAGGMEVPLNLKEDFENIEVVANVKDTHIESFLKNKKTAIKSYLKLVDFVYDKREKIRSRYIFENDKKTWEEMKAKYKEFWGKNQLNFSKDENNMIELLVGMDKGKSLSTSLYSVPKLEKIKIYLDKTENIEITHNLFNENWTYENSFIFLDPPYLTGIRIKKMSKGYNYSGLWTEKDDEQLVKFIKNNLNNNNVFLVFGSLENNLSKLLQKEFKEVDFIVKKYKKSIFGISQERAEWYCLIKKS